jgi:outer membrane protein assembly factor BamB
LLGGADWRSFRGNESNGFAANEAQPVSIKDTAWTVALEGRGLSSPIIVGDRVFLTSSSGYRQDRLHVMCFSDSGGEKLWERQFWATGRTQCHEKMCVATPTPATDGTRIFAFYSSNDIVALDLDGNLLWYRGLGHDFPNASNSLGMASSPIVVGDTVVVQVESDSESFAAGLDVENGISRWKIDRPRQSNWTSPAVLPQKIEDRELVLLQGSTGLMAVEARTGAVVWTQDGGSTIPSVAVAGDVVYVPSGGMRALQVRPNGSPPEQLWHESRLGAGTASPLAFGGNVFAIDGAGILACGDGASGKIAWQVRLKGPFTSSPVAGGGRIVAFNENGLGQSVESQNGRGRIVEERDLGEVILATPSIANGAVYVRSDAHLWKLGEGEGRKVEESKGSKSR